MKNKILFSVMGLVSLCTVALHAADNKSSARATASDARNFGIGFATFGSNIPGPSALPAISGWIHFDPKNSLQIVWGVNGTSPFTFGMGGVFRHAVVLNGGAAFHVGVGMNVGTVRATAAALATGSTTSFFFNLFPLMGFRLGLGNAPIELSFDGGPILALTPTADFGFSPLSAIGGASIHFFF